MTQAGSRSAARVAVVGQFVDPGHQDRGDEYAEQGQQADAFQGMGANPDDTRIDHPILLMAAGR